LLNLVLYVVLLYYLNILMALTEKAQKIMDLVKELSIVELNDLVKELEEEFDISASPVMVSGGQGWADEDEGDGTVDVELTEYGQKKISVIKVVKSELGVGLKEAKEMVVGAPNVIKEGVSSDEGEELKEKLEEAGAKVTLK